MQCPKCKKRYLKVFGTWNGYQKIEFKDDDELEVIDDDPGDFEWADDDLVVCLECHFAGDASDFEDPETVESCPKCGAQVTREDAFTDEGEDEEAGRTFYYCSEHCRETH